MKHYYIKILFVTLISFSFSSLLAQNLGETCEDAIVVSEGTFAVDNGITGNGASNICFGSGAEGAVWYLYTPSATGNITVSSSIDPNQTDTRLSVYTGLCNDLQCLSSDDDGGDGFTSTLDIAAVEGESVYVEWDDRWASASFIFMIGDAANLGCTDPEALNFNPDATFDDGSCIYAFDCDANAILISPNALNANFGNWTITDADGVTYGNGGLADDVFVCLEDGCYSFNMFTSWGDEGWEGSNATISLDGLELAVATLETGNAGNITFGVNTDPCDDIILVIEGCTDPDALNYNPSANQDDGSCEYPFLCDDVAVELYVCTFGNGDQVALEIVDSQGNVVYTQDGFGNVAIMYEDLCLLEGECYTVNMSNNTGPLGWYGGYYWINLNGLEISTGSLDDGEETGSLDFSVDGTCGDIEGCTDPEALNYNPVANLDDGSCEYPFVCDDGIPAQLYICAFGDADQMGFDLTGSDGETVFAQDGFDTFEIMYMDVCLDENLCYTVTMTNNTGPFGWYGGYYWINVDGVTINTGMLSDDAELETLTFSINGDCDGLLGCTDPVALNYNPDATVDDGSCEYPEPTICNASCEVISVDNALEIVYVGNSSTTGWGYAYLWEFGDGTSSTAPYPVHTYATDGSYNLCLTITGNDNCNDTYCMDLNYQGAEIIDGNGQLVEASMGFTINVSNTFVGIEENSDFFQNVALFPNPASGVLNVQYNIIDMGDVMLSIYDISGTKVSVNQINTSIGPNNNVIDLKELASGMYFLELLVDEKRVMKKFNIVK